MLFPRRFVYFFTDTGNYEFQVEGNKADPGFMANWRFMRHINIGGGAAGGGMCTKGVHKGVIKAGHGTLHDDERKGVNCVNHMSTCGSGHGDAGYKDNIDCSTTIVAPKGEQIKFTFTQMNLEYRGCGSMKRGPKWSDGSYGRGCPEGGCDYVILYDGPDVHSPMIGKYSGQPGVTPGLALKKLPVVITSGNTLHLHFKTDSRNCGITANKQKGDPGWFADWDFIENGQDICKPEAAILTDAHGTLHDDVVNKHVDCSKGGVCNHGDKAGQNNGYRDNARCGVRIHGPKGSIVNLHMAAMNLESCARARSVGYRGQCRMDPDRLEIYDGPNARSKLIARWSGDITDAVNTHDTVTSSGRDLYVRFVTDAGNWGLSKTTEDPGFYAEWQIIKGGQACEKFKRVPNTAIKGHNNEMIIGTVKQCEAACCARDWCKSFDFKGAGRGSYCNLADLDASKNFADTTTAGPWVLYERPETSMKKDDKGSRTKDGCAKLLTSMSNKISGVCCGRNGKMCLHGAPRTCSEECASEWMPFAERCSEWVKATLPNMAKVTQICEREEFGRFRKGRKKGRCNDRDAYEFAQQFAPACECNTTTASRLLPPPLPRARLTQRCCLQAAAPTATTAARPPPSRSVSTSSPRFSRCRSRPTAAPLSADAVSTERTGPS